jgi:cytochrome c oxidase subunit 2
VLLTRGLTAALAGLALAPAAANAGIFFPEKGGSENADKIWTLYLLIFILAWIVFIGVAGALVWAMIKFRASKGMRAAQIHGNTRLEIGWTVGAALILVFITAFTFIKLPSIIDPPASRNDLNGNPVSSAALFASTDQPQPPKGTPTLRITVDGQQYVWRYQYPGSENVFAYTDMYVPVGVTVILSIKSDDVAHSWWIPQLGGKQDAIPGYTNYTWFQAVKPGSYEGQCAELCGRNHANMLAKVIAVPPAQYQDWYRRQAAAVTKAKQAQAAGRKRLQQQERQTP